MSKSFYVVDDCGITKVPEAEIKHYQYSGDYIARTRTEARAEFERRTAEYEKEAKLWRNTNATTFKN